MMSYKFIYEMMRLNHEFIYLNSYMKTNNK